MKRKLTALFLFTLCIFTLFSPLAVHAKDYENEDSLTSENIAVFNIDKGFIVYGKSEHETGPLGGATKIMTALLALEYFEGQLKALGDQSTTVIHAALYAGAAKMLEEVKASLAKLK